MTESQNIVSEWLRVAGESAGHALTLEADGQCNILFGNNLQCMVEVPEDSDMLFIYIPLVRLPVDLAARSVLMMAALETNMFSLKTGGATVSYDRRTDYVVLTFAREVQNMSEDFFCAVLGDLLDLGVDLHEKLGHGDAEVRHSDFEPLIGGIGLRV